MRLQPYRNLWLLVLALPGFSVEAGPSPVRPAPKISNTKPVITPKPATKSLKAPAPTTSEVQKVVDAAAKALANGEWAAAEKLIQKALTTVPNQPELLVMLGIAQFELGNMNGAFANTQRALNVKTRFAARALLYQGLAAVALTRQSEARALFARLRAEYPKSMEVGSIPPMSTWSYASKDTSKAQSETGMPWWNVIGLASMNWDSHPANPYDSTSNRSLDSEADLAAFAFASVGVNPSAVPLRLRLTGSRFDYHKRNDLDSTMVQGLIEAPLHKGTPTTFTPRARLQRIWLGGDSYQDLRHGAVAWTQDWSKPWQSDVAPYWEKRSYRAPNDGRTCTAIGMDLRLQWTPTALGRFRRLTITGHWENADADMKYYGWDEYSLGAKARGSLPWRLQLDLDLRYRTRNGAQIDPTVNDYRDEKRFEGGMALSRPVFNERLTLELSVRQTSFDAWSPDLTYGQTMVALTLIAVY